MILPAEAPVLTASFLSAVFASRTKMCLTLPSLSLSVRTNLNPGIVPASLVVSATTGSFPWIALSSLVSLPSLSLVVTSSSHSVLTFLASGVAGVSAYLNR